MLNWVPLLAGRLNSATDGGVAITELATVDPLKKKLVTTLRDPIPGKQAWVAFQIICHAFAAVNDAAIQRISKASNTSYVIEVLIRDRHKISSLDPFIDNWKSNRQKRKEEYLKYLRDKKIELENELKHEPEPTSKLPSDPDMWCR